MYEELKHVWKQYRHIVFFGGAGVSTESKIPDFRSQSGIYSKKTYPYRAEDMISHDFFISHPKEFYDFYFHEMIYPHAKPNAAHQGLAKLEQMGRLDALITQNIDGLHQMAGSKNVIELHGSVHRNRCTHCGKQFSLADMLQQRKGVPRCDVCSHIIKPEVVLYGEALQQEVMEAAIRYISQAEVLIVGGTSLIVYPAAGLLRYFRGKLLVLINKEETAMDEMADLIYRDPIAQVFEEAVLHNGQLIEE